MGQMFDYQLGRYLCDVSIFFSTAIYIRYKMPISKNMMAKISVTFITEKMQKISAM